MRTLPKLRDLLEGHIALELESIDRLYLNGYVPRLQHGPGLVGFLCQHHRQPIAAIASPSPSRFARSAADRGPSSKKWLDGLPMPLSAQDRGLHISYKHFDLKQYFPID
jgi:hypothetical protein